MQADANDYIEKEFGAFYRSYPAQGGDALAYQRDGFLWNAAANAGKTVKAFGEYNNFLTEPAPRRRGRSTTRTRRSSRARPTARCRCRSASQHLRRHPVAQRDRRPRHTQRSTSDIPDQYRERRLAPGVHDRAQHDKLPNLSLIWMPDDHTAGVGTGDPNPVAEVADNDLAVGRIDRHHLPLDRSGSSSAVFVARGRHPGRRRPRRRPPRTAATSPARTPSAASSTRHLLHPAQRGEDHRADPRHRPDEPGGPCRGADVRRVHQHAEPHAVHGRAEPDPADQGLPTSTSTRRASRATSGGWSYVGTRCRTAAPQTAAQAGVPMPTALSTGPGRSGADTPCSTAAGRSPTGPTRPS